MTTADFVAAACLPVFVATGLIAAGIVGGRLVPVVRRRIETAMSLALVLIFTFAGLGGFAAAALAHRPAPALTGAVLIVAALLTLRQLRRTGWWGERTAARFEGTA